MVRCSRRFLLGSQYFLLLGASTALAALQLRTIDDEFGDSSMGVQPVYFPTRAWYQGANCTTCQLPPQPPNESLASQGTWHGSFYESAKAEYRPGISFSFTGTALSVWCIIPNPNYTQQHHHTPPTSAPTIIYRVFFILDGIALTENFTHSSDLSDVFQYNVSIFSIENLSNTSHSFTMVTSSTDPGSSVLFDYATYLNFQDTPATFPIFTKRDAVNTGSKVSIGVIIGAVLGGLFFVIIIILAVWYHLRWKRRQRPAESRGGAQIRTNKPPNRFTVDPFILDPPRSTLPRYHDYSPGPSSFSSSQTPSNPSQAGSSSGGGSRYGPLVPLQPLRSSSSPALSPSTSNEVLRGHGAPALSSISSPTSPVSQNSNGNSGPSQESANRNASSSRRHDRRHRHHRHRQREHIAEMRREVANLGAQYHELLARMEQPLPPVDDQRPNHEKLPEYTR
ncbi:hypothetical protein L218DRAFT_994161 [Marasmius fiardii PR-910]|nr:hypothetical protein L218DRAFT_994161 [Marasmius fiardii PR-910]